jgi:hypothetical protein
MTITPESTPSEAEDLANLDGLLLACLTEALKAEKPTAATMAVAQKFLAERKGKVKPPVPSSPFTGPAPFPPASDTAVNTVKAEAIRKALVMPFKVGSAEPDFRRP